MSGGHVTAGIVALQQQCSCSRHKGNEKTPSKDRRHIKQRCGQAALRRATPHPSGITDRQKIVLCRTRCTFHCCCIFLPALLHEERPWYDHEKDQKIAVGRGSGNSAASWLHHWAVPALATMGLLDTAVSPLSCYDRLDERLETKQPLYHIRFAKKPTVWRRSSPTPASSRTPPYPPLPRSLAGSTGL